MNVKELKELLEKYPDDMEIIYEIHSDYELLEAEDIKIVPAVTKGAWIMRSHRTMSAENKRNEKEYLGFPGN